MGFHNLILNINQNLISSHDISIAYCHYNKMIKEDKVKHISENPHRPQNPKKNRNMGGYSY